MFCLNLGLHLLRPGRDSLALKQGIEDLPAFFTATFICILLINLVLKKSRFGSNLPKLINIFHISIISAVLLFQLLYLFAPMNNLTDPVFFIWVSIINLLGISIAWEMIVKAIPRLLLPRKIGFIVFGGTVGCITAYGIAAVAGNNDLLFAMMAFVAAFIVSGKLITNKNEAVQPDDTIVPPQRKTSRHRFIIAYALIVFLYAFISTFLYFQQARLVQFHTTTITDSKIQFAQIGFWVNVFTLPAQLLLTSPLLLKGRFFSLAILPALLIGGLLCFSFYPSLLLLSMLMALTKIASFSIIRPSRELILTGIHAETRNRFKIFIDTVVYRGGDVAGSWFYVLLFSQGLSFTQLALVAIPVCMLWCFCCFKIQDTGKQNFTVYAPGLQIHPPLKNNNHAM